MFDEVHAAPLFS